MQTEIQELQVYYKGKLCVYKKEYDIVNKEIVFHIPVQKRYVQIHWKVCV